MFTPINKNFGFVKKKHFPFFEKKCFFENILNFDKFLIGGNILAILKKKISTKHFQKKHFLSKIK